MTEKHHLVWPRITNCHWNCHWHGEEEFIGAFFDIFFPKHMVTQKMFEVYVQSLFESVGNSYLHFTVFTGGHFPKVDAKRFNVCWLSSISPRTDRNSPVSIANESLQHKNIRNHSKIHKIPSGNLLHSYRML